MCFILIKPIDSDVCTTFQKAYWSTLPYKGSHLELTEDLQTWTSVILWSFNNQNNTNSNIFDLVNIPREASVTNKKGLDVCKEWLFKNSPIGSTTISVCESVPEIRFSKRLFQYSFRERELRKNI